MKRRLAETGTPTPTPKLSTYGPLAVQLILKDDTWLYMGVRVLDSLQGKVAFLGSPVHRRLRDITYLTSRSDHTETVYRRASYPVVSGEGGGTILAVFAGHTQAYAPVFSVEQNAGLG
ncbi:hypothetical protein Bbelb_312300 [Branchiostoma belcheri]|nr:hypothetical protein Bbelb_312300 [Branchiostoma belcheri]